MPHIIHNFIISKRMACESWWRWGVPPMHTACVSHTNFPWQVRWNVRCVNSIDVEFRSEYFVLSFITHNQRRRTTTDSYHHHRRHSPLICLSFDSSERNDEITLLLSGCIDKRVQTIYAVFNQPIAHSNDKSARREGMRERKGGRVRESVERNRTWQLFHMEICVDYIPRFTGSMGINTNCHISHRGRLIQPTWYLCRHGQNVINDFRLCLYDFIHALLRLTETRVYCVKSDWTKKWGRGSRVH